MSILKSVLTVCITVVCCRLVYNNGLDLQKIQSSLNADAQKLYKESVRILKNIYKNIDTSKKKKVSESLEILPNDHFQIVHSFDPAADVGKHFGDLQDIIQRGELVVCAKADDNNVLFQMKTKDGRYVGKDIDFAKQIAKTLGVKLTYRMVYKTYDDVVDAIARKEGDIGIAKLSYTPERSKKVLYSSPYVISRKTLLINRVLFEGASDGTLETLLNKESSIIGVTKDTCYEEFVTKIFPKATISPEQDWEGKVMQAIVKGDMVATIRDEVRVKLLLKSDPDLLIKLIPIIIKGESDSMSAIVSFDNKDTLLWLNKFIEANEQEVNYVDELIERYREYI